MEHWGSKYTILKVNKKSGALSHSDQNFHDNIMFYPWPNATFYSTKILRSRLNDELSQVQIDIMYSLINK